MLEEWKDGKEEEYWNGGIVKWWKKLESETGSDLF